jgi:hypothetical protein
MGVAALGFTAVGVLAASFPLELRWLPLLAPPAMFAAYLVATAPFFHAAVKKSSASARRELPLPREFGG